MSRSKTQGTLVIEPPIWYALMRAANAKPTLEVLGVGHARVEDTGEVVMDDLYIPPQKVTGASVDMSGDVMMRLWNDLVARYGEHWHEWCIMWHSHCSMGTSPSGTDTDALANVVENNWPFAVGLVVNVKGEATAWAEIRKPIASSFDLDVIVPQVEFNEWDEKVDEWMEKVEREVIVTKSPVVTTGVVRPNGSAKDDSDDDGGMGSLFYRGNDAASYDAWEAFLEESNGVAVGPGISADLQNDPNIERGAIDRLANLILAAGKRGVKKCKRSTGNVRCILAKGHEVETKGVHVAVVEQMPNYFLDLGVPAISRIKEAGLPI